MDLEREVLDMIVPTPEQVASIQRRADALKATVIDYMSSHGYDVEVRLAGSFSKNTFLADPDIDMFLMFPRDTDVEDLRRIGLQAGDDILHGERIFSDHPYTRGVYEGLEVDMVPCYRLDSTEHIQSAVDRTPFHTAFIKSRLDADGCNQVRLLKKFMKGIGTYGAEQDSRGFSGYLCELLVVKYGSFRKVLEASLKWRGGAVIEIDGKGPDMKGTMVVYDPVDNRRNVASAVHIDTMSTFIAAAKDYLTEPRMEFFYPKRRAVFSREELSSRVDSHGTRLISAYFIRPYGAIEDNLQSQLWKTQYALAKKLEESEFHVIHATHSMDETSMTVAFELEADIISKVHRHIGPPTWVKAEPFLEKWRGNPYGEPFVEDATWVVIAERQYHSAVELLRNETHRSGIGRSLNPESMTIRNHEETLNSTDAELLSELLDPRLPWVR